MLLEFSFANYRSFRDMQRFTMQAAPKRANDSGLDEANTFDTNGIRALKTKGIYGQNASGKSNILKAFAALISMVNKSVADEALSAQIWNDRFKLLVDWDNQPMFFQIIFTNAEKTYRYGFQIKNGVVDAEWLFLRGTSQETLFFLRSTENGINVSNEFHGASDFVNLSSSGNHEIFRKDSLFLTGAALMGNLQAIEVRDAIRAIYIMNGISDRIFRERTKNILEVGTELDKNVLLELMKAAETGTQTLTIEKQNRENEHANELSDRKIISGKNRYNEDGEKVDVVSGYLDSWESAGTQKWLYTSTAMIGALLYGRTLIIDEFDARFHPNLTLKIVNLFNNPKTNPKNAQLIFATHDTGLLRRAKFRRDQICFVDKDKYGVSSLKTLIEYKGVRKDESYEKEYLEGSYGAVAYLDDIDTVIADFIKHNDGIPETK